jgi:hypothetical protein
VKRPRPHHILSYYRRLRSPATVPAAELTALRFQLSLFDLVVDLQDDHVLPFVRALEGTFYVDEDRVRKSVRRRSSFNVIHLQTMLKVDIFILKDDPASEREMARRESYRVSDESRQDLFVASAEDTLLRKLLWSRLGGSISDRHWQDVLASVRVW